MFKGVLFMIIGGIDYLIGICDVKKLGGLFIIMFILFMFIVIIILSMVGVLFFNGFLLKEKFLELMINVIYLNLMSLNILGIFLLIIVIIGSIFIFVYLIKFILYIFFGFYKFEVLLK